MAIRQTPPHIQLPHLRIRCLPLPNNLPRLIHFNQFGVRLHCNQRGALVCAMGVARTHIRQVRALIRPDHFLIGSHFNHFAQPGIADQRIAVRQALRRYRMLQAFRIRPDFLVVRVQLDHFFRWIQREKHMSVGQRLHIMPVVVRRFP